jgi:two-component system, LuxR family, response regulator FixJ
MTRRTVYVVDDEEPIRGALKMMLGVQGFGVTAFASGAAFLDVVDALVPGCLLLDVRMPDLDGIEVQRRLAEARGNLPVVMMTGHADLAIALRALENGAVGFVEKPFAKATLRRALDAAFLKLEDPVRHGEMLAAARASVEGLDEEDRMVLSRLAAGRATEAIAAELRVGTAAIELSRARLFAALGIENLNEAVTLAFAAGFRP